MTTLCVVWTRCGINKLALHLARAGPKCSMTGIFSRQYPTLCNCRGPSYSYPFSRRMENRRPGVAWQSIGELTEHALDETFLGDEMMLQAPSAASFSRLRSVNTRSTLCRISVANCRFSADTLARRSFNSSRASSRIWAKADLELKRS